MTREEKVIAVFKSHARELEWERDERYHRSVFVTKLGSGACELRFRVMRYYRAAGESREPRYRGWITNADPFFEAVDFDLDEKTTREIFEASRGHDAIDRFLERFTEVTPPHPYR